ncbi:MAG: hypothetical protein IPJ98_17665 [Bryobacterales bacterium]|nr:hypothetical protein [Bryobacterales bacterium]
MEELEVGGSAVEVINVSNHAPRLVRSLLEADEPAAVGEVIAELQVRSCVVGVDLRTDPGSTEPLLFGLEGELGRQFQSAEQGGGVKGIAFALDLFVNREGRRHTHPHLPAGVDCRAEQREPRRTPTRARRHLFTPAAVSPRSSRWR